MVFRGSNASTGAQLVALTVTSTGTYRPGMSRPDSNAMADAPAVSIITPTYNHAAFLPACIESVLGQTFPSWEQIIIDDGSTDDTSQVIERSRDPRIQYVRQDHRGIDHLAETYNRALALCRAPLIAILEGDDYWPADKLEVLLPAFDDDEVVLAYGVTETVVETRCTVAPVIPTPDFMRVFPSGTLTNNPIGTATMAMLDCRGLTFTYPCSVILRRRALERIGGFAQRPGLPVTDYPTFLRLSLEGRFHFENRTMGYWRAHRDSITVRRTDEIHAAVYRDILRFRDELGARLQISEDAWRPIEQHWRVVNGAIAMRRARQLLLQARWREARRDLVRALGSAPSQTRFMALTGLLLSYLGLPIEWIYRRAGRAWFMRRDAGTFELIAPTSRPR